jgi:hypothetical protein
MTERLSFYYSAKGTFFFLTLSVYFGQTFFSLWNECTTITVSYIYYKNDDKLIEAP